MHNMGLISLKLPCITDIHQATVCVAIAKIERGQIIAVAVVLGAIVLVLIVVVIILSIALYCVKKGNTN